MITYKQALPTSEELLRQIIEAQVRGGYGKYEYLNVCNYAIFNDGSIGYAGKSYANLFSILLNSEGCKAAYGEINPTTGKPLKDRWIQVSLFILRAWHKNGGMNIRGALETAVSFLPK